MPGPIEVPRHTASLYRCLLKAYPRRFRHHYGGEMLQVFEDRYRRSLIQGESVALLWFATLVDAARNGLLERAVSVRHARPREVVGTGSAVGGGSMAAAAAFACLCCVLPSSIGLLGASVVSAPQDLLPLRPHLLAASLTLLLASAWSAYSPALSGEGVACKGEVCRLARTSFWGGSMLWVVALFAPSWVHLLHGHAF
jgi:hypothetical protein